MPKPDTPRSHVISRHTPGCPFLSLLETQFPFQPGILPVGTRGLGDERPRESRELRLGRGPLTAPSLHWRRPNKWEISKEHPFASKLAKSWAQPGACDRYVRSFPVLQTQTPSVHSCSSPLLLCSSFTSPAISDVTKQNLEHTPIVNHDIAMEGRRLRKEEAESSRDLAAACHKGHGQTHKSPRQALQAEGGKSLKTALCWLCGCSQLMVRPLSWSCCRNILCGEVEGPAASRLPATSPHSPPFLVFTLYGSTCFFQCLPSFLCGKRALFPPKLSSRVQWALLWQGFLLPARSERTVHSSRRKDGRITSFKN